MSTAFDLAELLREPGPQMWFPRRDHAGVRRLIREATFFYQSLLLTELRQRHGSLSKLTGGAVTHAKANHWINAGRLLSVSYQWFIGRRFCLEHLIPSTTERTALILAALLLGPRPFHYGEPGSVKNFLHCLAYLRFIRIRPPQIGMAGRPAVSAINSVFSFLVADGPYSKHAKEIFPDLDTVSKAIKRIGRALNRAANQGT